MTELIPYERYNVLLGGRLYPTGKCKKNTISYKDNHSVTIEFIQCRVRILGVPLWKRWVNKNNIEWQSEKEEIYDCEGLKKGVFLE